MSTAIKEERNIKKRKLENFLPQEIIYEIILFINDFKDFISFSQLNKYFYNTLLINENNILNLMLKKIKIKLNIKLPNYLFKINYLRAKKFGENNLLNNFKNLKYLEVSGIYKINNFIFPELDNLKELKLFNCDLSFNSLQYLKNLQKLEIINSCDGDDKINLENLINLIKLKMVNSNILENSLQKLINLEKLKLINSTEEVLQYNVDFSNLMKLKYLHICGMIIDSNNFNKLPNLEEFTCNLQEIDNLNNLKQIKRLKIINLENKKINNRRLIDKDLIDLPNIVKLNLQFNKDITGEFEFGNEISLCEKKNMKRTANHSSSQEVKKVKCNPQLSVDNDSLLLIFNYLQGYEVIGKCSLVCKEWFNLIMKDVSNNNFWKKVIVNELGFEPLELTKIDISPKDYYFNKIARRKLYFAYYIKQLMKEENINFTKEVNDLLVPMLFKNNRDSVVVKNNKEGQQLDLIKRKIIYSVENVIQDDSLINCKTINLKEFIEEKQSETEEELNYNYELVTNFTNKKLKVKELFEKEGKSIEELLQNSSKREGLLLTTNNETNIQPDLTLGNEACKELLEQYFEDQSKKQKGRGNGGRGLGKGSLRGTSLKGLTKYTLFTTKTESENEELLECDIDSGRSVLLLEKEDNDNEDDDMEMNEETTEESSLENLQGLELFTKFDELDINYYSPNNIDEAAMNDNKCHIIDDSHFAIGESKIGGYPDLPKEMIWPTDGDDEEEEKLLFISQMNVKQLSLYDYDGTVPKRDNNSSGMIYFWAMKGRNAVNNTKKGKIVTEVVTFVSDKDIKRMGGLERRRGSEDALNPKRLKFRNVFCTLNKELGEKDFTLMKEQVKKMLSNNNEELAEQNWEYDVYNLKKLWHALQNVKYKHYKKFGELLKYIPNYYGGDERLDNLDDEIFREFEVFCGQKTATSSKCHETDFNAIYQLSSIPRYKDVTTPIFSLYPECVVDSEGPYFHYGVNYEKLVKNGEIVNGVLVITEYSG
ncbi:hypothetical protein ABK040_000310 [Willaertia magna]